MTYLIRCPECGEIFSNSIVDRLVEQALRAPSKPEWAEPEWVWVLPDNGSPPYFSPSPGPSPAEPRPPVQLELPFDPF